MSGRTRTLSLCACVEGVWLDCSDAGAQYMKLLFTRRTKMYSRNWSADASVGEDCILIRMLSPLGTQSMAYPR